MAPAATAGRARVPAPRPGRVARPRLVGRIGPGGPVRVTVVSAPAGYGKTTLLAEWAAAVGDGSRIAWLALDERDHDPAVLWPALLSAVEEAVPGASRPAARRLDDGDPARAALGALLDELARRAVDVVLVLDDTHLVGRPAWPDLAFLVDSLPPRVHVVLSGRADPEVPLARLRARGELAEVRAADLRLTPDEVAVVATAAGAPLGTGDVARLAERTEGWAAAVGLALLAVRDAPDAAGVLARFTGEHRHVADYLVDEVLRRQPDDVRDFLLRTSVLDRLTGPLCDSVAGTTGGAARLEALDRAGLFVVPLDDTRTWYRYHHLFRELLSSRLSRELPGEVAALHGRASRWWAGHDEPGPAIDHALAAGDHERAASLVEAAVPAMRRARREATLRGWCDALPAAVVGARPALALGHAGALLAEGRAEGVTELLDHVERAVGAAGGGPVPPGAEPVVAQAAVFRAAVARAAGDDAAVVRHARRALELSGPDEQLGRGAAEGLLGLAAWSGGDLPEAERRWSDALDALTRAGHDADALGAVLALGDIRTLRGRLADAAHGYARALERAAGLRGAADMHVGLADVLRERDDLVGAGRELEAARALGDGAGLPQNRHRERTVAALLHVAAGDADGALRLLDEAERSYVADYFPERRPLAALRASVQAHAGRLVEARRWVRASGVGVEDDAHPRREAEHLALVRVLLAERRAGGDPGALRPADRLLGRVLDAAGAGGRGASVLEALGLRALVLRALGDGARALDVLDHAVRLAAPERHVHLLADEGAPMAALLRDLAGRPGAPAHAQAIARAAERAAAGGPAVARPTVDPAAVPPLTPRERDVLRLLAGDLDGPAIAGHLGLSLNTVRTHTRHVYAKLGVQGRRAAVRRAAELGLLRGGARLP